MATSTREFEQVTEITSTGLYIFASDMRDRAYNDPLPGDGGLSTDNIFGQRPNFDYSIQEFLIDTFPNIRKVDYQWVVSAGKALRGTSRWQGENGIICLSPEYYRFFTSLRGDIQADIPYLAISGTPRPTMTSPDGELSYTERKKTDPNGVLELELVGSRKENQDYRGPYWRGRLQLEGDRLGSVIDATLEHINQTIKALSIPVWKETHP